VRHAFKRHRDELPEFTGVSLADCDPYYAKRKRQKDGIAKGFDAQRRVAAGQF